jgi:catechol 2,3-dioxygenase-like lactoylglutathione lyase family enzyme
VSVFWIDHIGVVARDLDESIAFYTKLFGEPIDSVQWRGEFAANVAKLMGKPEGLELDAVFFRIPHTNAIFELVAFRNVEQAVVEGGSIDIGATHFGFYVDDIDETVAQLGLEVSGSPMELPIGPYRGGRSVYLKDPNGANIQLMQLERRPGGMPILRPGAGAATSENT